jgi:hypothetical protein
VKMEAPAYAASPFIDLDYVQSVQFSNLFITSSGTPKTVPFIQQVGSTSVGLRPSAFTNLFIETAVTGPTYVVQVARSAMSLRNWSVGVNHSPSALVRVDSTVVAGAFQADDPITAQPQATWFSDARAAPEYPRWLTGSKTWDAASTADGAMTSTTVTVTGATLGMLARASFSLAVPAGAVLSAAVTASDTVTVTLFNKTGGALDLASGTLRADAFR